MGNRKCVSVNEMVSIYVNTNILFLIRILYKECVFFKGTNDTSVQTIFTIFNMVVFSNTRNI